MFVLGPTGYEQAVGAVTLVLQAGGDVRMRRGKAQPDDPAGETAGKRSAAGLAVTTGYDLADRPAAGRKAYRIEDPPQRHGALGAGGDARAASGAL